MANPDKKKNSKFYTSIMIGGALGSLLALVFGRRRKGGNCAENGQKKQGLFGRLFGK